MFAKSLLYFNCIIMIKFALLWPVLAFFIIFRLFQRDFTKLLEEVQQLTKSLLDSEAIALDAKKESSFLRTENLELKEKMASIC